MTTRCEECGGRFDRPGLFDCDEEQHTKPDLPRRIIQAIEADIRDRRGFGFGSFDDETQDDIRDEWARLIHIEIANDQS